ILAEIGVLLAIHTLAVVIHRLDHQTYSKFLGALARAGASRIYIGVLPEILRSPLYSPLYFSSPILRWRLAFTPTFHRFGPVMPWSSSP
ncbi:hypothetical protein HAX54_042520, partial [Datura stramonium]|nr:hypothetical protein [Datura stramonium]